ncbi:TolC family outer membrane protein [Jannaschia aquimarina]|uniref:BepC protein n=1 Tax=Jannaschia aquimarina TaxID=935700 RepID=A0A0D1D8Q1_9RHOB|nr:TolC family outer membrane protein [Jannaschia aquimarina]KIT16283.1 Outer membrane efflux protein BepC precursor [Jannaschia aquimarina]SNT14646.1 outer membrane protein [Jannaschia aquimarina]
MKRTFRSLALAAAVAAAPIQASAQSLTDALVLAYESSPLLEQQRNLLRGLDEDVAVAVSALRPVIQYFARLQKTDSEFSGTNATQSLGLSLNYTILDGGQRAFRIAARKEAVLAGRWNLIQVEQNVLLNAVAAYLNLRFAARVVDVRESNVRLISEQLRAARDRFEVGEVTRTDVAIAQARLAAAQSSLAAARGNVDIARETYRLATGQLPSGRLSALPPLPELPPSVERAQELAVQIHPNIKALQHDVTANQLLVEAAAADRLPTVGTSATVGRSNTQQNNATLTIETTGTLYSGGRLPALERQAVTRVNAARAALVQEARVVADDVGRAWAQLQIARAQVLASDEQVRSAQLAFEGFREEAALGARTTLDVLDSEQELLDARTARLEAETDAQQAVYSVLAAIGLLTTDHLGLAVERYDPDAYYTAVRGAPVTNAPGSLQGTRLDRVLRRFNRN